MVSPHLGTGTVPIDFKVDLTIDVPAWRFKNMAPEGVSIKHVPTHGKASIRPFVKQLSLS